MYGLIGHNWIKLFTPNINALIGIFKRVADKLQVKLMVLNLSMWWWNFWNILVSLAYCELAYHWACQEKHRHLGMSLKRLKWNNHKSSKRDTLQLVKEDRQTIWTQFYSLSWERSIWKAASSLDWKQFRELQEFTLLLSKSVLVVVSSQSALSIYL